MKSVSQEKFFKASGVFLIALSIVYRCFGFPKELGHYDSFNFAFALDFYHLPSLSPHFPGYPWYILVSKCFYWCGCSKLVSLIFPGFIASILSLGILWKIAKKYSFSENQKLLFVLFYAWNPLIFIYSLKAFSDSLALFLILMSFYESLQKRPIRTAFWLALGLGTRPSYLILGVLVAFQHRKRGYLFSTSFFLAMLPLFYFYWIYLSWNEVAPFIFGHFNQWGGTLWSHSYGFSVVSVFLGIFFCAFYWKKRKKNYCPIEIQYWLLGYGLWIAVAQNLNNPRHFLPLVFPVTFLLIKKIQYFKVLLFLLIPYIVWTLILFQGFWKPSLYTQFSDIVIKRYTPLDVKIYGGKVLRVFDEPSSWKWNKRTVVDFSEVQEDLKTLEYLPPIVLMTSEIKNLPDAWNAKAILRTRLFCPFWIYAPEHEVEIYHFSQEKIKQLLNEANH